jgi:hypothetical protein
MPPGTVLTIIDWDGNEYVHTVGTEPVEYGDCCPN